MRPFSLLTIAAIGLFAFGCHGAQRSPEIILSAPTGLEWVKIVAKGIE